MALDKILYTAHATATGGRTGTAESSDGALKVALSTPKELGGAGGAGTNPEQMFAAGYAACFIGALKAVATKARAQKAGARGLRTILEKAMLDVMYEIPSSNNIREVVVNEDTIANGKQPVVVYENEEAAKEAS